MSDADATAHAANIKTADVVLTLSYDRSVNYAFQQNAIPVVKELRIQNDSTQRKDLIIRVTTEPAFAGPAETRLASLEPGGEFRVAPLDLNLSHDYLAGLNEKVSGWIKAEVEAAGTVLASLMEPISLLARDEWCGLVSLPEILAAFVLPNDPAVMTILGRAAELLREHTDRAALNGYQDKNRKRAWDQVAAIYSAIGELGIRYISPQASFEDTGQKVRFPSDVLSERFGTCLDLALLVAACCEQAGLHPLVLMHQGHAYAGCWLEDRTLAEPAIDDLQHVRKLEADELITVFEATALTGESRHTLRDAEMLARPYLDTYLPFRLALDVVRARMAKIYPLPIPGASGTQVPGREGASIPADKGIGGREFSNPFNRPSSSPKALTRVDLWKSRLLDLTLRNRFLNFKETKSSIRILSASPADLEDEFAADREFSLRPKPRLMGEDDPRNPGTYTKRQREDALVEHLRDELTQGRLHTDLKDPEHPRRLTELYRAARAALDENGANTLFAAVGFLEWRETEHSDRILRAPILLVPVQLKRKSALEGFTLRMLDDETRLNVTLMEMLRQHFEKEIPGLDPLPGDESGVDVDLVLQTFRDAVRDLVGWEVKSEVWLGQFSFTKFLLWKDLNDRLEALTANRVVNHLVNAAGTQYANPSDDIIPTALDDQYRPCDVFCPRSADSSQLAAIMAAAEGHDFVLEGPPGTGKSQTITNIIAHCLAEGKRVLFVAEKRTALEVVHRRLREEGLDPFCLELHSNKTGKSEVLGQFDQSLKFFSDADAPSWQQRAAQLESLRGSLNGYARGLHKRYPCGLGVHDCLDYLLPRQAEATVRLEWPTILEATVESLESARDLARRLQERSRSLVPLADHPLELLACEDWSPNWAERTQDEIDRLGSATDSVRERIHDVQTWLGSPTSAVTRSDLTNLRGLSDCLLALELVPAAFVTSPWGPLAANLERWASLARERSELRGKLAGYDETKLLALDLAALQGRLRSADDAWFLVKWLRIGSVRRQLRTARSDNRRPEVVSLPGVLEHAIRLKEINGILRGANPTAEAHLGVLWAGGEPAADTLERIHRWGSALSSRMVGCAAGDLPRLGRLRQLVSDLLAAGPACCAAGTNIGERLIRFRDAQEEFTKLLDAFASTVHLRRSSIDSAVDHPSAVRAIVERVTAAWGQIRDWCSWQRVRREAFDLGLAPLVAKVEAPDGHAIELPAMFERSFRRALFFAALESEPKLGEFFGHEHDERIDRFRVADEKLAALASQVIRSRLSAGIPRDQLRDDIPKAEIGLLRREIAKKTRHIPVRRLLSGMPNLLPRLKPCVLMSPLSVAQYLEVNSDTFDVVVFDEASQIPVWDAVGAIARGKQLIVVGDPKQLPPTNFFNSNSEDDTDLAAEEHRDLESILDELLSNGMRHKRLQWHYRSRNEGLIAFSNRHYYDNSLLTFPSPDTAGGGVVFKYLSDARYDMGKSRTNRREAEALVAELVSRLRKRDGPPRSYGVVTFSIPQQQLVENLLDEERRKYPELEIHFGDSPPLVGEPVIVKNLESVQGEERDVIMFSICYGPDEAGRISMNFGPLNRDGGERRLNVAITRAKHEVLVFTCLRSDQVDLTRTRARGVRDLKYFLDYAERGPKALAAATAASADAEPDSEFERMVAVRIRAAGYEVHLQVGCSGYRIDIGVVDPAAPGRYLLGVECDGATYHRAATARDRDKLRQFVLEDLGWKLFRIWSTDWWHDSNKEMARLLGAIDAAKVRI
jgi:very-short-patch-repair endonuclease